MVVMSTSGNSSIFSLPQTPLRTSTSIEAGIGLLALSGVEVRVIKPIHDHDLHGIIEGELDESSMKLNPPRVNWLTV